MVSFTLNMSQKILRLRKVTSANLKIENFPAFEYLQILRYYLRMNLTQRQISLNNIFFWSNLSQKTKRRAFLPPPQPPRVK